MDMRAKVVVFVFGAGLVAFGLATYFLLPKDDPELTKAANSLDSVLTAAKRDNVPTTFEALYPVPLDDPSMGNKIIERLLVNMDPGTAEFIRSPSWDSDLSAYLGIHKGYVDSLFEFAAADYYGGPSPDGKRRGAPIQYANGTGVAFASLGRYLTEKGRVDEALRYYDTALRIANMLEMRDANEDAVIAGWTVRSTTITYMTTAAYLRATDEATIDKFLKLMDAQLVLPDPERSIEASTHYRYGAWKRSFEKKRKEVKFGEQGDIEGVPVSVARSKRFYDACDATFIDSLHKCILASRQAGDDPFSRASAMQPIIDDVIADVTPVASGAKAAFNDTNAGETIRAYAFVRAAALSSLSLAKIHRKTGRLPKDLSALGAVAIDATTKMPIFITRTKQGYILSSRDADQSMANDYLPAFQFVTDETYGGSGGAAYYRVEL